MKSHSDKFGLMTDTYFPKGWTYSDLQKWFLTHRNKGIIRIKDGRFVLESVEI